MKTAIQIFLKQTLRGKKRLILNSVLLFAVTAFFVVSLNLYYNSTRNLLAVENAYTMLATVEFYGNVDAKGNLVSVSDPTYVGNRRITVTPGKYDLSSLLELDMVSSYDLRPRFCAYIPGQEAILNFSQKEVSEDSTFVAGENEKVLISRHNIIRFVVKEAQPIEVNLERDEEDEMFQSPMAETAVKVQVTYSARELLHYPELIKFQFSPTVASQSKGYTDEIRKLNRTEDIDKLILYPGEEYILSFFGYLSYEHDLDTGEFICVQNYDAQGADGLGLRPTENLYDTPEYEYQYNKNGEVIKNLTTEADTQPYFIQRWEDVQTDSVQAAYWEAVAEGTKYTGQSYWVTLTDDIETIPAWYAGGMYLHEGRMISAEEYKTGARVCMVSAQMAALQGWSVGDTLDMNLFSYARYVSRTDMTRLGMAQYTKNTDGFFDQGTYTIVGIFGQQEITNTQGNSLETYYQPWDTIYAPTNSVQNKPDESTWLIHPSTFTIKLKNGSIDECKAAVEEMGLTEQKTGEYQLKFSYFDQGYDKIKPGLDEMHRNAKLLLGLSAALLAVTMVLTAFLFSRQHKHSAGILRMLGGSKGQAFIAIFTCAAAVVATGGVVGAILGGVLTQNVGASTMGDAAASAAVELATGASPVLTTVSGVGCMVLFLLLTAIFTATYITKEPRALLPEDKE